MSEARADLPQQDNASSAMGLRASGGMLTPEVAAARVAASDANQRAVLDEIRKRQGQGGAGDTVVSPQPNAAPQPQSAPAPDAQFGGGNNLREAIKAKWIAAGATPQAAEGIAMRIEKESGFDPTRVGDGGTSFGLYQHHNDRAMRLLDFAKSQGKSPSDPMVQTDFAIKEATSGGDPMATQHSDAFMKASNPNLADAAFGQYFERPATLRDQMFTPVGMGANRQRMDAVGRDASNLAERDRAEYERLANASDPGSKERQALLDETRARAKEAREMYAEIARHPPSDKPIDALSNFGSIGTMLALLIGGMGRHHMNGALMAAGGMMQAAQANNHEEFERQYKIWDHRSSIALNLARLEGDEIREIMEDRRMSENERQARLHSFYEEHQMSFQAQQMQANLAERAFEADQRAAIARESAANQKHEFGRAMFLSWLQSPEGQQATPEKVEEKAAFYGQIAPSRGAASNTGTFSKDAIDALVQQAMTVGPAGIMPSLPRAGPARAQFENAFAERLKQEPGGIEGGTAKVIMNQMRMAEAKSAASTAGRVTMNTELYSQEAAGAGKLLIDASNEFPRSNFTTFNQALAAYETKTGDPRIIKFGTALNSLVNAYGKMTNPTGTGIHDADKESLRRIIDTSLSQKQIEAGVQQILAEGRNVSTAAQRAQEEVLRRIVPGAGGTPSAPVTTPPTPASPAATSYTPGTTRIFNGKLYTFTGGDPADKANWKESPMGSVPTDGASAALPP